jgi:hypothetical protein
LLSHFSKKVGWTKWRTPTCIDKNAVNKNDWQCFLAPNRGS